MNALGEIYFVDDTTIRKIGLDGNIDTVIGTQDLPGQYVPMPCGRAADLYEVSEKRPLTNYTLRLIICLVISRNFPLPRSA